MVNAMNFVFLSPDFPPNNYLYCAHLHNLGARVLGISDQPHTSLHPELASVLTEYHRVSDLHNYDEVLRALGYFTYHYGKINRVDSLNEYWLATEAQLRTDFNIDGYKLADLSRIKRKSEMKRLFVASGLDVARGELLQCAEQAYTFVEEVGYPVVAKPDIGVGATRTYKLTNQQELETFLHEGHTDYLLEEFIEGVIQTFDGLTDQQGIPVFYTSMQYSHGVMEVVNNDSDVYYFTQRRVPQGVERAGRMLLQTFGVRERFFHFEFFRTPEGRLVVLEVNVRPPGGLSIDMFNYANNIDLYYQWASVVVQNRFSARFSWPYHVCYAGRKHNMPYMHTHDEIMQHYPSQIVHYQPMSCVFRAAMGDYGYLIRSSDCDEAIAIAQFILAKV
jgi:hypothetical protein